MPYQPSTPSSSNPFESFSTTSLSPDASAEIVTGTNPTISQPGGYLVPTPSGTTQRTQAQLTEQLAQMSKADVEALQGKLIQTGLFPSVRQTGLADTATLNAYLTVLSYSHIYQVANPSQPQNFTPDDVLDTLIKTKPKDASQTTTTVNLTNPTQAKQAIITAFSDKLGRRPTDAETAAVAKALNDYERANPDTQTAEVAGDGSGTVKGVTNSAKGTGTLSFVNDFASNYAQTDPSLQAEYQAAQHLSFYALALQALTNGPVNTGLSD